MAFVRHDVPAPEARAFYFQLRKHGARRRSAPWWTVYYLVALPTALALIVAGSWVQSSLLQANLWGIGAAALAWPLLLWVVPETFAVLAYLRWVDAEGWQAAERPVWDRKPTQHAKATQRSLRVRYRVGPRPVVRVGSRTLALRGLHLERVGDDLVASRNGMQVATLSLAQAPERR